MTTFTSTHEYVVVECGKDGCAQHFGMSRSFYDRVHKNGSAWYCPAGHARCWPSGKTDKQKLAEAEARLVSAKDQLRAAAAEGEATRRALVRDRHRFSNGVCPCCNRSFTALTRHMRTQHPGYDPTKVVTPRGTEVRYLCSCGRSFATPNGLAIHQGRVRRAGWDEPGAYRWRAHLTEVGS